MVKSLLDMLTDTCTVTEYIKYQKPNKATAFKELVVLENLPCRLSFKQITAVGDGMAPVLSQSDKLFIAPDVVIKPGSKITVYRGDTVTEYSNSGQPAVYPTHREIALELFKGWA